LTNVVRVKYICLAFLDLTRKLVKIKEVGFYAERNRDT